MTTLFYFCWRNNKITLKTKLNRVSTSQVRSVRVSHQHVRINYPFPQVKAIRNYVLIAMFPQIMPVRASHQHARINHPFPQVKAVRNYVLIAMFSNVSTNNAT